MSSSSPDTADRTEGDHSLNPHMLKELSERRNVRSDGSQPKKRGPKPDSKPALTRRQELNRQAQRTHRERKELYIKALEDEVLRLKEIYSDVSQDKTQLAEENKLLRDMLSQHSLTFSDLPVRQYESSNPDNAYMHGSSAASDSLQFQDSGASSSGFSPGLASQASGPSLSPTSGPPVHVGGDQLPHHMQQSFQKDGIDYEQAGIDFVLTLERPCMTHLPFMMQLAIDQPSRGCGHALMATCPPQPFTSLPSDSVFGHGHGHNKPHSNDTVHIQSQQTWTLSKGDLATLLDLSAGLGLGRDGEITPVTAWSLLMSHPRLPELELNDLKAIARALEDKIRCFGFGAVTEEFEVRDAIENTLVTKSVHWSFLVR